jgi:hypothetical protein
MLVASSLPPRPTSTTATSTPALRKWSKQSAVAASKKRRLLFLEPGPPHGEERFEIRARDLGAVDADPLLEPDEMRGRVEPRLEPRGAQDRREMRGGRNPSRSSRR